MNIRQPVQIDLPPQSEPTVPSESPEREPIFWDDTKDRVNNGWVTPFLSNYMSATLFQKPRGEIAKKWAEEIKFPFTGVEREELAHVAQFLTVKKNSGIDAKKAYLDFLTRFLLDEAKKYSTVDQTKVEKLRLERENQKRFSQPFSMIAAELGLPHFDKVENNPFRLLAEMPLPLYITTSHHDFLERALAQTGNKIPVSEIFYWGDHLNKYRSIYDDNPNWMPTKENPLVYHLYGLDRYPDSIILNEDDHLDLLDKLAVLPYETKVSPSDSSSLTSPHRRRDIPAFVRMALTGTALLTLGYKAHSWEFRVLYRGIIQSTGDSRKGRNAIKGICMQIEPNTLDGFQGDDTGLKDYLKEYLDWSANFHIYWGSVEECVHEMWDLWNL